MTTRTRRVLTAIDASGHAFSEIHREIQVGDQWYPIDPVPLQDAGEDAAQWKADFNAAQQAEIDQLRAAHASVVETLNSEHATALEAANGQISELTTAHENVARQLSAMTAERDEWKAKVPPPPKPREVTPAEFIGRLKTVAPASLGKIWASEADIAAVASATLFTWPGMIDLDSERLREMLGGLVQAELLTADEMTQVLE